jgi:hypothetical protein
LLQPWVMDQRIVGGKRVDKAEKLLESIDALVRRLCREHEQDADGERAIAIREAGHAASFAVASIVWAHHGSADAAREIEKRALAAYHALAGGVSQKEKQFAVLQTLEIAATQKWLERIAPEDVLEFFRDRIKPAFPMTLLRGITFEDLAPAIDAAGRKPGRRAGSATGQRSKPKSEVLNEFLKKLGVNAATGAALEKAREIDPEIPRLPD